MMKPAQRTRRRPSAADSAAGSARGSIREVCLLGTGGPGPGRRPGSRIEWAGRAYRVAQRQREPFYLYLELEPIPQAEPAL